jgi:hypothetical protein
MPISYSKANELLRYLNGQSGTLYIGLSTTAPGRDGTGYTEPPTSAGYKRMKLSNSAMTTPSDGQTQNQETIYFSEATADWGTCTYFCLFNSETAYSKDLVAYGALPSAISPTNGKVPLIRVGNLQMSM